MSLRAGGTKTASFSRTSGISVRLGQAREPDLLGYAHWLGMFGDAFRGVSPLTRRGGLPVALCCPFHTNRPDGTEDKTADCRMMNRRISKLPLDRDHEQAIPLFLRHSDLMIRQSAVRSKRHRNAWPVSLFVRKKMCVMALCHGSQNSGPCRASPSTSSGRAGREPPCVTEALPGGRFLSESVTLILLFYWPVKSNGGGE
jgi:hypothetical protein